MRVVRDIALTVMAVLVSIVCAGLIYFALATGSALSKIGQPDPAVTATLTPDDTCLGEQPLPDDC